MRHAAIVINGILRDPITGQPDELGRDLYHALANNYRLTLLADTTHHAGIWEWLRVENFARHFVLETIDTTHADDLRASRLHQIRNLRAIGPLDLVVTPEPNVVPDLYAMGQPCLLHVDPKTLAPLPPLETWQDLAARIEATRNAQALALQREEE